VGDLLIDEPQGPTLRGLIRHGTTADRRVRWCKTVNLARCFFAALSSVSNSAMRRP
jgi:hypothetical protein